MAVDERRYYASGLDVYDRGSQVACAWSVRLARRIANALNLYRPKVRVRKRAEKQQATRGLGR